MDIKAHSSKDLEDLHKRTRQERNAKQWDRYRASLRSRI
jgi:hypothetical protein